MNFVRSCSKQHTGEEFSDYDVMNWNKINKLRHDLAKDTISEKCLLSKTKQALDEQNYELASDLQLMITETLEQLEEMYENYKKNLF